MYMNDPSHTTLLKEIAEFLNEETEIDAMLQGALTKLLQGTKFETGWVFFINERGRSELITHVSLPPALSYNGCDHLKKGGCWCVSRYRTNKLQKASNIIECQRIEAAIAADVGDHQNITHHATVPLQSGHERFGLLNVATPNTIRFNEEELELLESVAFQIGSAIKRILLTKQAQEMALVQERNRLARDLHDSVNQLLFSVTLTARAGVELSVDSDVKELFQDVQSLTQEALTEMRALIWQLRPKGLEGGLVDAIKSYAEMLGLTLQTNVTGVIQLPSRIEEGLFRMMQEGLNNVRKHAGVTKADFYITVTATDVLCILKDDGRGFSPKNEKSLPSVGMQSIRSRVEAFQGKVEWISEIGKGTELFIRIPY